MPEVPNNPNRYLVTASMDDAPHLTQEAQEAILRSMPPHQRDARRHGTPSLGAGSIYPVPEEFIAVNDFDIPAHFARCFGMDTGFKATAGVWIALNRETLEMFIYSCYKRGGLAGGNGIDADSEFDHTEPVLHAEAFKSRGSWIPGLADAAAIRSTDGKQYVQIYRDLGLNLVLADKRSIEANILAVFQALSTGKLKVFKSCLPWFEEYRVYRRNENGQVVRQNDHLMAATQYAVKGCRFTSKTKPEADPVPVYRSERAVSAWM
jgi:hypothetical protein